MATISEEILIGKLHFLCSVRDDLVYIFLSQRCILVSSPYWIFISFPVDFVVCLVETFSLVSSWKILKI